MGDLSLPGLLTVKIWLAGSVKAESQSGYLLLPRSKRARAVLAIVALSNEYRCSRSHLATLLWDDASEDAARASLRQALHDLAKSFDATSPGFLRVDRDMVSFDQECCWIDVHAFGNGHGRPQLEFAEIAELNPHRLLEELNGLSPSFDDWLRGERTTFEARLAAEMDRQLSAALLSKVSTRQKTLLLGQILKSDPTHERACRAMMRTYVQMGETALALKEFERCRAALQTTLDVEPSLKTRSLYQTIRATSTLSRETTGFPEYPRLPDRPSIAVLPFQNMSGDPEKKYFADGMVEDIIAALSRIRWLFVIARNSSFIYDATDVKQAARALGVRYVLEGSVRQAGNRVRVTAQLIDATSGAHVWAERYDRDLDDIFAVQDEITASVAGFIEPALAEAEQQRALRKPPERLDAWEAYQRGVWHFNKYGAEENRTALSLFQRAIKLDPKFAAGHHGYALALQWDIWHYSSRSFSEVQGVALEEARIAVSLDDKDAMAHAVLAHIRMWGSEWVAAIAQARTAHALNPNSAFVISMLGCVLGFGGHREEALLLLQQAMRASPHDPLTWLWTMWTGILQFFSRRFDDAIHTYQELNRLRPGFIQGQVTLVASLAHSGRIEEARGLFKRVRSQSQDPRYLNPPYMRPEDNALRIEGIRLAGLPK